jgi:ribonuclease P protein component
MKKNLTKKERLSGKNDISDVFSAGRKISVPGMKLVYKKNQFDYNRVMIIPRKKFGRSVDRNKIKRTMREIYRNLKNYLKPGYDLVFIVFPGEYNYGRRSEQAKVLLRKAGILIGN